MRVAVYDDQTVILFWAVAIVVLLSYYKLYWQPQVKAEAEARARAEEASGVARAAREKEERLQYWVKREVHLAREHSDVRNRKLERRREEIEADGNQRVLHPSRGGVAQSWVNGDPARRDDVLGDGKCCGTRFSELSNAFAGAKEFPAALKYAAGVKNGLVVALVLSGSDRRMHQLVMHDLEALYARADQVSVWIGTLGDVVSRELLARPVKRREVPVMFALLPLGGSDYRILQCLSLDSSSSSSSEATPSESPLRDALIFFAEAQALMVYGVERFSELNPGEHTTTSVRARQDAEYETALLADMQTQSVKHLALANARERAEEREKLRAVLQASADSARGSGIRLRIKCAALVANVRSLQEERALVVDVGISASASVYSVLCLVATQQPVFQHRGEHFLRLDEKTEEYEFGFILRSVHPSVRFSWECRGMTVTEAIQQQVPGAEMPKSMLLHADES